MSSWLGASFLGLGEWFIKKMPLVSYIYSASKQISAAISPGKFIWLCCIFFYNLVMTIFNISLHVTDQSSNAFEEVVIIRHPRIGEYAFGFITSTIVLQRSAGEEKLCCVYVPSNHLYLGEIFLITSNDVMRPNLSVREGIGMIFRP